MKELYLRCKEKNCDVEFPSGIIMDEKSFESSHIADNFHKCPRGHIHRYSKRDYFFKE